MLVTDILEMLPNSQRVIIYCGCSVLRGHVIGISLVMETVGLIDKTAYFMKTEKDELVIWAE